MTGSDYVRSLMASILASRLIRPEAPIVMLSEDVDLRDEGIVDSLGFVQLITELELRLGFAIDLSDLDGLRLTNVGVLSRHIAGSLTHS